MATHHSTTHADGHSTDEHAKEDFAHPSPPRVLLATFGALVLLTIITVVLAVAFEMGRWEVWVSIGIASVKATLVMLFFMHMLHDKPFNALVFLSSVLFVGLFIGITLMDTDQYQNDISRMPAEEVPAHTVGQPPVGSFLGGGGSAAE